MDNEFIEEDVVTSLPKVWSLEDIAEMAWGVIANVNGSEWDTREVPPEWRGAAERWRDQYYAYLKRTRPPANSDVDVSIIERLEKEI